MSERKDLPWPLSKSPALASRDADKSLLRRVFNTIAAGLRNGEGHEDKFRAAIIAAEGADLSMVWPRLALLILTDPTHGPPRKPSDRNVLEWFFGATISWVAALYEEWVATGTCPAHERWAGAKGACMQASINTWTWVAAGAGELGAQMAKDPSQAEVVEVWAFTTVRAAGDAGGESIWPWLMDELLRLIAEAPREETAARIEASIRWAFQRAKRPLRRHEIAFYAGLSDVAALRNAVARLQRRGQIEKSSSYPERSQIRWQLTTPSVAASNPGAKGCDL